MATLRETLAIRRTRPGQASAQSGEVSFGELAWAHYEWEQQRADGRVEPGVEEAYREKLRRFEDAHGRIARSYWSTVAASAAALTVRERPTGWDPFRIRETDVDLRIHRVSDWLVYEPELADLLQQCDQLALRVREILRGTSERIAMGRIYGVVEHVLGCVERAEGTLGESVRRRMVRTQLAELKDIESFYLRAGGSAGRVVYFTGMLLGALAVLVLGLVAAGLLQLTGVFDGRAADDVAMLFMCFGAGAVGSLVSVMSRLRPGGAFRLDFEVGRQVVRRLGLFRPAVGAVFGVVAYALLRSGVLLVNPDGTTLPGDPVYYFAVAAFIAGFSERWMHVVIGEAGRSIGRGAEERKGPAAEDPAAAGGERERERDP